MPPKKKRRVSQPLGIRRQFLQQNFSSLPEIPKELKNGHVLKLFEIDNEKSRINTSRQIDRHFKTVCESVNDIKSLVERTSKFKKLADQSEFERFHAVCNEPFFKKDIICGNGTGSVEQKCSDGTSIDSTPKSNNSGSNFQADQINQSSTVLPSIANKVVQSDFKVPASCSERMPPKNKRKVVLPDKPGIAREYLTTSFSCLPDKENLKNGHILCQFLLHNRVSRVTVLALCEYSVAKDQLQCLVKRTLLKFRNLNRAADFAAFKLICEEKFRFRTEKVKNCSDRDVPAMESSASCSTPKPVETPVTPCLKSSLQDKDITEERSSSPIMTEVLLIEPFYTGSHKQLMDTLHKSIPASQLITLPGKKWPWKARTSALYLSQTIPRCSSYRTLFTSSVLNLAELIALRDDLRPLRKVVYFHENQLTYPVRQQQDRDFQYGYNQILSCLVADLVLFNSQFNMESFLGTINTFLKKIPDHRPKVLADKIRMKCQVLYFPIVFPNLSDTADDDFQCLPDQTVNDVEITSPVTVKQESVEHADELDCHFIAGNNASCSSDTFSSEKEHDASNCRYPEDDQTSGNTCNYNGAGDTSVCSGLRVKDEPGVETNVCSHKISNKCDYKEATDIVENVDSSPASADHVNADIGIQDDDNTLVDVMGVTEHEDTDVLNALVDKTGPVIAVTEHEDTDVLNALVDKTGPVIAVTEQEVMDNSQNTDGIVYSHVPSLKEGDEAELTRPDQERIMDSGGQSGQRIKYDGSNSAASKPLHIVWPHRWEYDKGPESLFSVLIQLQDAGYDFRISVLGETFTDIPEIFGEARERLCDKVENWGYVASKGEYYNILQSADCVVSTAQHEFFGVAMLEAVHCGCYPLCPNRLVYPEIFPKECLYNTGQQLFKRLRDLCRKPHLVRRKPLQFDTERFSWKSLKHQYMQCLQLSNRTVKPRQIIPAETTAGNGPYKH